MKNKFTLVRTVESGALEERRWEWNDAFAPSSQAGCFLSNRDTESIGEAFLDAMSIPNGCAGSQRLLISTYWPHWQVASQHPCWVGGTPSSALLGHPSLPVPGSRTQLTRPKSQPTSENPQTSPPRRDWGSTPPASQPSSPCCPFHLTTCHRPGRIHALSTTTMEKLGNQPSFPDSIHPARHRPGRRLWSCLSV